MSSTYKSNQRKGTLAEAVSGAHSEAEALGEEMREAYDNMSGSGMSDDHPKVAAFSEAADTLEGIEEPDVPSDHTDIEVEWVEMVPRRKNYQTSRSVRASNAAAAFTAAAEAAHAKAEELREDARGLRNSTDDIEPEDDEETVDAKEDKAEQDEKDADGMDEQADALDELADACENAASELEGVEFPGMFG